MSPRKSNREREWAAALEAQFIAAYDEHADALFRHVLMRVRDRERAKDIVQEAFSRTWVYLSKGKQIEHIKAFLFRVAHNLIVDLARKKKSSSLDTLIEEENLTVIDENTPDPTERQAVREALKFLSELDEIYRVAITMRYFDEMSPKEIALALGVSENVVSVRIHRGIERLQARFTQESL
ncbi:MAG TPA: sigma-70 family RNA polymerase sigma factor [Candidatus Paceibacterota bacterium]|nr:sigma-70 family RNA polymerase sigma factor [Candidatus Paceibacterota bacterium]